MSSCSSAITGRLARVAALAALALTVACGGGAGTTDVAVKPPVAAVGLVDVVPALQTMEVGQTTTLAATVRTSLSTILVRVKMIALSPTWSIPESLQGVRVIEFSLAPSDTIPRALVPLLARGSLPGSDAAP